MNKLPERTVEQRWKSADTSEFLREGSWLGNELFCLGADVGHPITSNTRRAGHMALRMLLDMDEMLRAIATGKVSDPRALAKRLLKDLRNG